MAEPLESMSALRRRAVEDPAGLAWRVRMAEERAEAAEARVAELEQALLDIRDVNQYDHLTAGWMQDVARAALKGERHG